MTSFSIRDAAFTGFRVVRENPQAVAIWATLYVAVTVAVTLTLGPVLAPLESLPPDVLQDPVKLSAHLEPYMPALGLLFALTLILNAVLNGAMNRAILRPGDRRFGFVRLGLDELRQLALILVIVGLTYLATLVGLTVVSLISAIPPQALLGFLIVWCLGLTVFFGTRLSLASALTFESGKIDLLGAWRLSRARFWRLFSTYLLASAMSLLVLILATVVTSAATALASGGIEAMDRLSSVQAVTVTALLQPGRLVSLTLSAIAAALTWPLWMTPPAAIYQALAHPSRTI